MANTFEDMQALMAADLRDPLLNGLNEFNNAAVSTAEKVAKTTYLKLVRHQNLRTYSTSETLHSCPRRFAKQKLEANYRADLIELQETRSNVTFAFGHAVGAGVAVYDQTQDIDQAIWAVFLAWDVDLLATENKIAGKAGKSFAEACWAIYAYQTWYNESFLPEFDVVNVEAVIAVDLEDGHFYSGHLDELLVSRGTGHYLVKENKTDGSVIIDPAKYSNSDQALSYSIVIDMLGAASYTVLYTIYSAPEQRWLHFEFVKPVNLKADWIQDQLLINQQIDTYAQLDFFPKRGSSCMRFNRRCEFYETCDNNFELVYGDSFSSLPKIQSIDDIDALEHVDYRTTLTEIVERQKEKLHG